MSEIDMVNNPPHYTQGGIETIDYIQAKSSPEEFIGFLRGNIFKYTTRIGLKGDAVEDAGKIEYFAKRLKTYVTGLKNKEQ